MSLQLSNFYRWILSLETARQDVSVRKIFSDQVRQPLGYQIYSSKKKSGHPHVLQLLDYIIFCQFKNHIIYVLHKLLKPLTHQKSFLGWE